MVKFVVTDSGTPAMSDTLQVIITVNDVVQSDLVAWWDFNDGEDTILTDRSGNGNHGTINGATWVDGIDGKALRSFRCYRFILT